ncbi:MAG: hypothetical protein PF448_03965 [Bacteroidales bacterium]|jgi:hypothetical protein|nr:hypothetical protein [Bacteroidales bacterium]
MNFFRTNNTQYIEAQRASICQPTGLAEITAGETGGTTVCQTLNPEGIQ